MIEVVMALALAALLSLIIVAMFTQLRSIITAREKTDARIEVEALAGYLEKTISSARVLPLVQNDPQRQSVMIGNNHEIEFAAVTRVGGRIYSLRNIRIYVDHSYDQTEYVRLMQSLQARRLYSSIQAEIVELASIDKISFRYWNSLDGEASTSAGWVDNWQKPWKLPPAVEVEISITRSGYQVVAKRIVQLRAYSP